MKRRLRIFVKAFLFLFIIGLGIQPGFAQTTDGPRLAVQVDGLIFFRGDSESLSSVAFSPFLAFELRIFSRMSLRVGLSPPLGQQSGRQAFATNLALNAWLGRGPDYFETGLGSYYQNTWCNGMPDYRAYALYLGWRHVSRATVFRFGGNVGMTPGGKIVIGIGIGFGRAIGSKTI
ncbi:MAG: hypothetical protein H6P98_2213 [Candidatus Aminicenantes bacterium]|nr:hypothetical protein [Candidatus Aminicenantes bacterium]